MLKPMRRCSYPGCRMITNEGRCPAHKLTAERRESAAWHYLYTNPRYGWSKRRRDQLLAEPFCRECARSGFRIPATDVDHIEPHRGDVVKFTQGQLQSLCHSCHSRKTMGELNQQMRARRC